MSAFRPVARAPLSLLVYDQLREAIVSGELVEGTELPSEKELSERFSVSRSTVREALRVLQAQGMLTGGDSVSTARPRVSTERTFSTASEAMKSAMRIGQVPLDDLVGLRILLETTAAQDSRDAAQLASARRALELMQEGDLGIAAYLDIDVDFHISIAGSSGNAAFRLVMTVLREVISYYLTDAFETVKDPKAMLNRLTREHAAILDELEAGRGDTAAKLIHDHIWDFYIKERHGRRSRASRATDDQPPRSSRS
jgi:GntR family transcriptional repressor for pyruvate dehydrogenase complex